MLPESIRKDFPAIMNNPDTVYLDSACMALKPKKVIDAILDYYNNLGGCGGRSAPPLLPPVSSSFVFREVRRSASGASLSYTSILTTPFMTFSVISFGAIFSSSFRISFSLAPMLGFFGTIVQHSDCYSETPT